MLNYENANYNELFNYSYSHYRKYLKEYPMTNRTFIIILLSLTTIIQIINSASSPPIWVASSFFKAGTFTFTFSSLSISSQNSTITYTSAIVNTNLKVPTIGITDLGYLIQTGRIYLLLQVVAYTATNMKFQVDVNQNSYLTSLKLTYMALDNLFTPAFSMNFFFPRVNMNGTSTAVTKQFYVNFTASTGVTLNLSHQNVLLPFMHYIDLTTYDNTVDINLDFTVCNQSFYTVIISSTSRLYLNYAGFSRLIFDKTAIESMGNDYFNYGIISSINNNATTLSTIIPPDIITSNLYYGLHSFTVTTGLSSLNFTSAYTINTGAIGYTSVGGYNYAKMKFSYIHHKTRTCPAGYPYYNISEVMCYDQCGARWFGNTSALTCNACLYDCLSCTSGTTCTSCSSTNDFRTLNGTRCSPISGYFDNGTNSTIATPCSSPCATCITTATYCLSCVSGYYLSSHQCNSCGAAIPHCLTCTISTYCTLCSDGSSGSTCTTCTTSEYLNSTSSTCIACSTAISYCQTCSSSTDCTLCATSFTLYSPTNCSCASADYLSSGQCWTCSSAINYCITCTSSTHCTSCMNTFVLASPTQCSCNSSAFLNLTSTQCQSCIVFDPYCTTCTNYSCTHCLTTFSLINGSCICSSGYYANSTLMSCESCTAAITNCLTCSTVSTCLTCSTGYQANAVTGQCDLQPCQILNCYTCNAGNYSICTLCDSGYSLSSPTTCSIICGDGQLHSSQSCDDGNLMTGDGCSSSCSIESGFSCANQYVNATLTYSACYYTGNITFDLVWIKKIQGSNSLKFEFVLNQNIAEWKNVNFTQILEIDMIDQSTKFNKGMASQFVAAYSAKYEMDSNRFSVTIQYFGYTLQKIDLSFSLYPYAHGTYPTFTPPSNVQFFSPTISKIVKVIANNNQNANLYSQQQYNLYSVSVSTTYAITGIALFTVLTSLIFRAGKVITFEMLTIVQITYFSLAFLDSLNPVFSGLLPLRYITGILNFRGVEQYLQQSTSPNSMKGVYMFLNLSSNFNFIALSLALFLGLGGLLFITYLIVDSCANSDIRKKQGSKPEERNGYWLYKLAFHFIGQLSLSMIIACMPLFTISLFFQILYTINKTNFWSYGEALGVGIAMIAYFIALIKHPYQKNKQFSRLGEYISQYHAVSIFKKFKYTNFQMLVNIVISGLVMVTIYSNNKLFSTLCIIFVSFLDIVFVAVIKPYKFGFVSCSKGEDNNTEAIFQKIQLYKVYDKQQPQIIRVENPDLTQKSQENENTSQIFAQHFATKKNILKSKHQGLVQAGQVLNHSKLFLFNNNIRRIINLTTLIVVEFVFACTKIYEQQINKSYSTLSIQMFLPLIIHIILFLNVIYNYMTLILQILNRTKQNMNINKVENDPDSSSQFMKSIYTQSQGKKMRETTKPQQNKPVTSFKSNKVIIQSNANTASLYDLKRPQILNPYRTGAIRRTNGFRKTEETE